MIRSYIKKRNLNLLLPGNAVERQLLISFKTASNSQWVQRANFQDFVQSDFKASWAYLNFLACDLLKIL